MGAAGLVQGSPPGKGAAGLVQARDAGAMAQGGSGSMVELWLDSGFIFLIEPKVFPDKSVLGHERGIKDVSDPG